MAERRFVKSADTSVPVERSRAEVERLLLRHKATGFSVAQDYASRRVVVSFIVPNTPDKDAPAVPVQLPVEIRAVYDALYGQPRRRVWQQGQYVDVRDLNAYSTQRMEQAERVAWRHLVLWIDAALTAAQANLQSVTEAFFAHAVVQTDDGERLRFIDVVDRNQAAFGRGVRALLAAPAEEVA